MNENRQQRLTTITEELSTKQENVQKLNSCNEELNKLLADAKTTIIELQHDLKVSEEKVETLRHQNEQFARDLAELKSINEAKKTETVESVASIALEPIAIANSKVDAKRSVSVKVKRNRPQSSKNADNGHRSHAETKSSDEDDSSEDMDTYVVYECTQVSEAKASNH